MHKLVKWIPRFLYSVIGLLLLAVMVSRILVERREVDVAATAAPAGGRFVQAGDVRLFVQEAGDASAPAVLFVHGTGAWSETWRTTMTALASGGFRAIALDLPPFGYSDRPASSRYDKQTQGSRIASAVQTLALTEVVLVGHSFGGGPTVEVALSDPTRVRGLVLVDAALNIGAKPADPSFVISLLGIPPIRDALVGSFLSNPRFTKGLLEGFIADAAAATDERVAIYQRPLTLEGTTRAFGEWLPALLQSSGDARSEDPASYRALTMPVAVIWGDLDTITPLSQGQNIASLAPGAQLLTMKGVGHIPQIESPQEFNTVLLKALAELRR